MSTYDVSFNYQFLYHRILIAFIIDCTNIHQQGFLAVHHAYAPDMGDSLHFGCTRGSWGNGCGSACSWPIPTPQKNAAQKVASQKKSSWKSKLKAQTQTQTQNPKDRVSEALQQLGH